MYPTPNGIIHILDFITINENHRPKKKQRFCDICVYLNYFDQSLKFECVSPDAERCERISGHSTVGRINYEYLCY